MGGEGGRKDGGRREKREEGGKEGRKEEKRERDDSHLTNQIPSLLFSTACCPFSHLYFSGVIRDNTVFTEVFLFSLYQGIFFVCMVLKLFQVLDMLRQLLFH